jgi:hypothetical protein
MRGVTCSAPITVRFQACIGGRPIARPIPARKPGRCGRSLRSVILSFSRYIVIFDISGSYPNQEAIEMDIVCRVLQNFSLGQPSPVD